MIPECLALAPPKRIYFDHNATTAVAPQCVEAMGACLRLGPLNPSSKHSLGGHAKRLILDSRLAVSEAFGASPAEVVFTSGGTESNHLAIQGALAARPDRRHIVSSEVEHPSTLQLLRHLETQGVHVSYLPVDAEGRLSLDALAATLTEHTALVTLMWANNETGVLFPIPEIAQITRQRGILLHTDAVQAAGKLAIDWRQLPVDLLSLSGHKLQAPTGIGALIVRKGLRLQPQLFGSQERGRRGGTENLLGIIALGVACTLMREHLPADTLRLRLLRERLEAGVLARLPFVRVNGAGAQRVSNTSNLRFGNLDAELLLERLDRAGFCASAGAACSATGTKPSHVLRAMGLSVSAALASVRISLGRCNSIAEVDEFVGTVAQIAVDLEARAA
jgi:cysteine desulfurase